MGGGADAQVAQHLIDRYLAELRQLHQGRCPVRLGLLDLICQPEQFLVLLGAFKTKFAWAAVGATGVILSACYMLWMFQRVVFGPVTHEENERLGDLTLRERLVFAPLLLLIFWMGVMPQPFLDRVQPALDRALELTHTRAVQSAAAAGLPAPTGFVADALHHAVYEAPETWVKASPSDSVVIR